MDQNKRHDIALMKYSAIAPIINGLPDVYSSFAEYYRKVATDGIKAPDGSMRYYSPITIASWLQKYKKNGFDELMPSSRADLGKPRNLDDELQTQIRYLKKNYPRITASAIYRQLQDNGSIKCTDLSLSTVNRFVNHLEMELKLTVNQDMRRYERPHINEVWCGDSSVGPYLKTSDGKKHKVYVIALIDDASRFITGIDIFFNDNFINLMSVIKSAVAKYGRPKVFNFDNGSSYRNKQMELLAARIGSTINYDAPYTPVQKAKIERWFRTMKDQWMAALDMRDFNSLDGLRESLYAYVQKYNQTVHSSLNGKSPQERFFSEPEYIKRLSSDKIESSFLLEIERKVSADSVIVIDQIEYEVDYCFARRKVRLRYSPDMENIYIVEADDTLTAIHLLNKHDNAHAKREKVLLCRNDFNEGDEE